MNNNEVSGTDPLFDRQAVVHCNMETLFDLEHTVPNIDLISPFIPADPLLLTPNMVHDILHSYYSDLL